jgi:hypothetical protein
MEGGQCHQGVESVGFTLQFLPDLESAITDPEASTLASSLGRLGFILGDAY